VILAQKAEVKIRKGQNC